MKLDSINNSFIQQAAIVSVPSDASSNQMERPYPPASLWPQDEHVFRLPFGEHHAVVVANESQDVILLTMLIQNETAFLHVGSLNDDAEIVPPASRLIRLEDKDQTIHIDREFWIGGPCSK